MTTNLLKNNNNRIQTENWITEIFTGSGAGISFAVVILGFLTATFLLLIIGRNPSGMYQAMIQVITGFDSRRGTWNTRYVGEWFVSSMPLILCALSMGFAAMTGLFNIGAEGQYIAGVTAAQVTAIYFPAVPVLSAAAVVTAAVTAGALWGGIAGFLKAKYKVSEVVATIMLNYIALYLHRIISLNIPGSSTFRTADFNTEASLSSQALSSLTNGSRLNNGLWLTIAAVIIYWIIKEKTTLGYSLRAVGLNKDAALYAGINVKINITLSMIIAGSFAGLAGAVVSVGTFNYGRILVNFDNYGFDAIAVALAGNCGAIGITIMGFLFGMLKSAQPLMQSRQIPMEIASIIMGLVVVFLSLRGGIKLFIEWRASRSMRQTKGETK